MDSQIELLADAVIKLASDDRARAKILGVSPRTITEYKAGRFPRVIRALIDNRILTFAHHEHEVPIIAVERG